MKILPEEIIRAWENREGPAVFGTADCDGVPNLAYVSCVGIFEDSSFVVADNYFDKTRRNILDASKGSILFITKDRKAYQIKGFLSYEKEGRHFDFMKSINPAKHPGHAAAVLDPEEAFSGARRILPGGEA